MIQPKIHLKLPTQLSLNNFINHAPLEVKLCSDLIKSKETAKIAYRLTSLLPFQTTASYNVKFILHFLLIKINSWRTYQPFQSSAFVSKLEEYFNQLLDGLTTEFKYSRNDGELMVQILLKSKAYEYVDLQDLQEILQGSGLIGATVIQTIKIGNKLIEKCYFNVVLGSVSLNGRTDPYIPIVHLQKSHCGQITFAARINQLIHLRPQKQKENKQIIQDAYSLRCSPQVHGISLECLDFLKESIEGIVSKPQTRYLQVDSKRIRNLALRSQNQILLLDNLIFSLNQIGHMSYLRGERIVNRYLTKNDIKNSEHYDYLMILLKKTSYLVVENKLLAIPSNSDTILFNNYQNDIYVNDGSAYKRFNTMIGNIKKIFMFQLFGAIEVLSSLHERCSIFQNMEMQKIYELLVDLKSEDSIKYGEQLQKWLQN